MVYVRLKPTNPASRPVGKPNNYYCTSRWLYSCIYSLAANGIEMNATAARNATLRVSILSPNQRTMTRYKYQPCSMGNLHVTAKGTGLYSCTTMYSMMLIPESACSETRGVA